MALVENKIPDDYVFNLEKFIEYFEDKNTKTPGVRIELNLNDCVALCIITRKLLSKETTLLEIPAPIKICGDIHGQWLDLMKIFKYCGKPSSGCYLFLGDYVDRGACSLETICILFAYKIKYPNRIYLLRGNHESPVINRTYGFFEEVNERFNEESLFTLFNDVFQYLPIAAIVDGTIFCCHGGLSPKLLEDDIHDLREEFDKIKRPIEIPPDGLICDLLWSDPIEKYDDDVISDGWGLNSRGCSFVFNDDIVTKFLDKYKLKLIVRAHQVVPDGYEFFCNRSLVTLFSVANYCGTFDNAAAVLVIDKQKQSNEILLKGGFHVISADKDSPSKWTKLARERKKSKATTNTVSQSISKSEESVSKSEESVPNSKESVPKSEESVPKSKESVPKSEESVSKFEESVSDCIASTEIKAAVSPKIGQKIPRRKQYSIRN